MGPIEGADHSRAGLNLADRLAGLGRWTRFAEGRIRACVAYADGQVARLRPERIVSVAPGSARA
jgi:hypothetical protein